MSEAGHLRLVDHEGQVHELEEACPLCAERDRELARMRRIVADLRADKLAEARGHELWPQARAIFVEWQTATGHTRSKWPGAQGQRFWLVEPYLRTDGFVIVRWAVWGVAYMPNTRQLPDGHTETYDDFELAFRTRGHFERYAKRGYRNPEARKLYSLREQGIGPDDERIDPNKHFARSGGKRRGKRGADTARSTAGDSAGD